MKTTNNIRTVPSFPKCDRVSIPPDIRYCITSMFDLPHGDIYQFIAKDKINITQVIDESLISLETLPKILQLEQMLDFKLSDDLNKNLYYFRYIESIPLNFRDIASREWPKRHLYKAAYKTLENALYKYKWYKKQHSYSIEKVVNYLKAKQIKNKPKKNLPSERSILKKSINTLQIIAGKEFVSQFLNGDEIHVSGHKHEYTLKKKNVQLTHSEWIHIPFYLGYRKKNSNEKYKPICVIFPNMPVLDQVASFLLYIKSGKEEELLSVANELSDVSTNNAEVVYGVDRTLENALFDRFLSRIDKEDLYLTRALFDAGLDAFVENF